ncbi:MAG TPA: hypothetical protein VKU01_09485 [Bryobacteraceae bacterium]|nr:hypothetical protein [Bryobacteraceae bacterium]
MRHSDWQVAVVAGITVAAGIGGSGILFSFRNSDYANIYDFVFLGTTLGIGVKAGALQEVAQAYQGLFRSWHPIRSRPFSAVDLHESEGGMLSLTAGPAELTFISAGNPFNPLFEHQSISGFQFGWGYQGALTRGVWLYAF